MSEYNKYGIEDLISAAVEQKPSNFEAAFNDIVIDRIRAAVENKKIEVAQQLYNYEPEVENDDEFGAGDLEIDNSEEEENGETA
jgi:thioredoxin-like negative regulator of GroEL